MWYFLLLLLLFVRFCFTQRMKVNFMSGRIGRDTHSYSSQNDGSLARHIAYLQHRNDNNKSAWSIELLRAHTMLFIVHSFSRWFSTNFDWYGKCQVLSLHGPREFERKASDDQRPFCTCEVHTSATAQKLSIKPLCWAFVFYFSLQQEIVVMRYPTANKTANICLACGHHLLFPLIIIIIIEICSIPWDSLFGQSANEAHIFRCVLHRIFIEN